MTRERGPSGHRRRITAPTVVSLKADFEDGRGTITDLVADQVLRRVTMVRTRKGSIRGNHYHTKMSQCVFVLKGQFKCFFEVKKISEILVMKKGDLLWIPKGVPHAFLALKDTESLELSPIGYSDDDTHKLAGSLVKCQPLKLTRKWEDHFETR